MVKRLKIKNGDWICWAETAKLKLDALPIEVDIGNNFYVDLGYVTNVVKSAFIIVPVLGFGIGKSVGVPDDLLSKRMNLIRPNLFKSSGLSKEAFEELIQSESGEVQQDDHRSVVGSLLISACFYSQECELKGDIDLYFLLCKKSSYEMQIKLKGYQETKLLIALDKVDSLEKRMAREGINLGLSDLNEDNIAEVGGLYAMYKKDIDVLNLPKDFHVGGVAEFLFTEALKYKDE